MLGLAGLTILAIIKAKPKCTKSFFLMIYGPDSWKSHIDSANTMRKLQVHPSSHTKPHRLSACVRKLPPSHYSKAIVRMMLLLFRWGTDSRKQPLGRGGCASMSQLHFIFHSSLKTPQTHLPSEGGNHKGGIWHALLLLLHLCTACLSISGTNSLLSAGSPTDSAGT